MMSIISLSTLSIGIIMEYYGELVGLSCNVIFIHHGVSSNIASEEDKQKNNVLDRLSQRPNCGDHIDPRKEKSKSRESLPKRSGMQKSRWGCDLEQCKTVVSKTECPTKEFLLSCRRIKRRTRYDSGDSPKNIINLSRTIHH